jgi:hypothetical protein
MPIYFFDSSALAKRYVAEAGSNWVKSICNPVVSTFTRYKLSISHDNIRIISIQTKTRLVVLE